MYVLSLGQEGALEKEMATHTSILAWEFPWTEESSRLQSMESQRVRRDLASKQRSTGSHLVSRTLAGLGLPVLSPWCH